VARDGFLLEWRNWRNSKWTKFCKNYFLGRNFLFAPCLSKSKAIGYKQQSFRAPLFVLGELGADRAFFRLIVFIIFDTIIIYSARLNN